MTNSRKWNVYFMRKIKNKHLKLKLYQNIKLTYFLNGNLVKH